MITVPAVQKDGAFSPESYPEQFGHYFDGVEFFFYESEEEKRAFKESKANEPQVEIVADYLQEEALDKLLDKLLANPARLAKLKNKLK